MANQNQKPNNGVLRNAQIAQYQFETFLKEGGHESVSTFMSDFVIADAFGEKAIKDTYKRAVKEWKSNYKMYTELVMVLNHQAWRHENNILLCQLYCQLYEKTSDDYYKVYKDNEEALSYYYRVTD